MGALRTSEPGHAHGQLLREMHVHGGYPINDGEGCSWYLATDEVFRGACAPGSNSVSTPVVKIVAWYYGIPAHAGMADVGPPAWMRRGTRCFLFVYRHAANRPMRCCVSILTPLNTVAEELIPSGHGMYALAGAQITGRPEIEP